MIEVTYRLHDFFVLHDFRYADFNDVDTKSRDDEHIVKFIGDLRAVIAKWAIFCPRDVIDIINEYGYLINSVHRDIYNDRAIDKRKIEEDVGFMHRKLYHFAL